MNEPQSQEEGMNCNAGTNHYDLKQLIKTGYRRQAFTVIQRTSHTG